MRNDNAVPGARGLALLVAMFFLPLFARNMFPMVRDKQAITFASSFTDPQMVATYIFALYVAIQLLRYPQALSAVTRRPLRLLCVWALVALASISVSTFALFSLWRVSLLLLALFWCALVVVRITGEEEGVALFKYFYRAYILILLGMVAGLVLDPAGAWYIDPATEVRRLQADIGFHIGPNELGVIAAVVALGSYARVLMRFRIGWAIVGAGALIACYLAHSRTGYAVLLLGGLVLSVAMLQLPAKRFPVLAISGVAAVLIVGAAGVDHDLRSSLLGVITRDHVDNNLTSLGGRTAAWELGWQAFLASPWLGYGYSAYPAWFYNNPNGHFHNIVVESLVTMGIAGVIPIVMLLLVVIKGVIQMVFLFGRLTEAQRLLAADLIVVGTGIILANQTSAAATYYSSDMIALCVWLVGAYALWFSLTSEDIAVAEAREAVSHTT